jgi:hypothetical protein
VKETKAVRITDTLLFHHKEITQPTVTVADALVTAAAVLAETVKTNMAKDLSKLNLSELERLANILHEAALKTSEANATKTAVPTPRVNEHSVPATPRVSENISPAPPQIPTTADKDFDIEDAPNPRVVTTRLPHPITQDDDDDDDETNYEEDAPGYNTRSQTRKRQYVDLTSDVIFTLCEISNRELSHKTLASKKFPLQLFCEFAGAVMCDDTGDLLEYRQLAKIPKYRQKWTNAFGKEIGRLAQGIDGIVEGTNTIFFVDYDEIPEDRKKDVTYARICVNYRPEKADPNRCRITLGGNLINYPGDVGTRTADMLTVKLLLNSVISTPGAKFMPWTSAISISWPR